MLFICATFLFFSLQYQGFLAIFCPKLSGNLIQEFAQLRVIRGRGVLCVSLFTQIKFILLKHLTNKKLNVIFYNVRKKEEKNEESCAIRIYGSGI